MVVQKKRLMMTQLNYDHLDQNQEVGIRILHFKFQQKQAQRTWKIEIYLTSTICMECSGDRLQFPRVHLLDVNHQIMTHLVECTALWEQLMPLIYMHKYKKLTKKCRDNKEIFTWTSRIFSRCQSTGVKTLLQILIGMI